MKRDTSLRSLEEYGKPRFDALWLTAIEFVIAGLPIAFYLGQSLSDVDALMLGLKCLLCFFITGSIRLICRMSVVPTGVACAIALLPVVVIAYHAAGYGVPDTPVNDGWDY